VELDDDTEGAPGTGLERAIALLDRQESLLMSVATGGPRIQEVNARYVADRRRLQGLLRTFALKDPFPFADLWEWHGHWSQHLASYAQRRAYLAGMAKDVRDALEAHVAGVLVDDPGAPAGLGWSGLDARVKGLADELRSATTEPLPAETRPGGVSG
jgi:hypothetical protein